MTTGVELLKLANSNPEQLLHRIQEEEMSEGLKAFAMDALGQVRERSLAVPTLLAHLTHGNPDVVREAAMQALGNDVIERQDVRDAITEIQEDMRAAGFLRSLATAILEDL